jgi:hypothetical protein
MRFVNRKSEKIRRFQKTTEGLSPPTGNPPKVSPPSFP